jgi:hypothetical protein
MDVRIRADALCHAFESKWHVTAVPQVDGTVKYYDRKAGTVIPAIPAFQEVTLEAYFDHCLMISS